jgi:hypothetical protein
VNGLDGKTATRHLETGPSRSGLARVVWTIDFAAQSLLALQHKVKEA